MKITQKIFLKSKTHSARVALKPSHISNVFKLPAMFAAFFSVIFVTILGLTASVHAWGPERPTYTNKSPADYATFNSITDNAAVGDERNFVRIREAGTDQYFGDEIEIVPGHEYEVYIYYHNNAASDTNSSGVGIATNVRVASAYPPVLNTGDRGMVSGIITWSYVTPSQPNDPQEGSVWDEAYVTTSYDGVVLKYKTGSAVIHNSGKADGSILSTALFTNEGTPIGFNKLSGTLPGCAEYSGHITYTLIAENPSSELTKQVSLDGENWYDRVTAKPGDVVTYKAVFKNTGNTNFTNLILKDSHDDGLLLNPGSTQIFNYDNPDGVTIDDIIDLSGYNTGDIYQGGMTQLIYQMQVRPGDDSVCNKVLVNTVSATFNTTENKTAGAEVKVYCEDGEDDPDPEDCKTNPNLPGCEEENCTTNPNLPGCTPTPSEDDCNSNPNLPGCNLPSEIVQTGPLEIVMAVIVVLGICGAGFYLWRTKRTLKTVEGVVSGDGSNSSSDSGSDLGPSNSPSSPSSASGPSVPESSSTSVLNSADESQSASPYVPSSDSDPLTPAGFSTPAQPSSSNPGSSQSNGSNSGESDSGSSASGSSASAS